MCVYIYIHMLTMYVWIYIHTYMYIIFYDICHHTMLYSAVLCNTTFYYIILRLILYTHVWVYVHIPALTYMQRNWKTGTAATKLQLQQRRNCTATAAPELQQQRCSFNVYYTATASCSATAAAALQQQQLHPMACIATAEWHNTDTIMAQKWS